jgi:hypothetical protein
MFHVMFTDGHSHDRMLPPQEEPVPQLAPAPDPDDTPDEVTDEAPAPPLSPDVIEFLRGLLGQQTIRVGDPNFEQITAACSRAKAELEALA